MEAKYTPVEFLWEKTLVSLDQLPEAFRRDDPSWSFGKHPRPNVEKAFGAEWNVE